MEDTTTQINAIPQELKSNKALNIITGIGGVFLIMGFIPSIFFFEHSIWETWEILSLAWSLTFVIYYVSVYQSVGDFKSDKIILLYIFLFGLIPVGAIFLLINHLVLAHLITAAMMSVGFLFLDWYIWRKQKSDSNESKLYWISFILADVPFVICNLIIATWLWNFGIPVEWEIFASGVIAANLLVGNIIFICIQSGAIKKISEL